MFCASSSDLDSKEDVDTNCDCLSGLSSSPPKRYTIVLHLLRRLHLGFFKGDLDKVLLCTWGVSISQAFVAKRPMNSFQVVFTNVHCKSLEMQDARVLILHARPLLPIPHADNGFATMLRAFYVVFRKKTMTSGSI